MEEVVNTSLEVAKEQSLKMAISLENEPKKLPKSITNTGTLETCNSAWWVSGFFPGVLWYLYEDTKDPKIKDWAHNYTTRVEDQQYTTDNHDVGFMIYCSFGNGYRLTENPKYKKVINNASKSLITRYDSITKTIRSWDYADWSKQWQYPVIIDNMMNLELLMWSAENFNNSDFKNVAETHANTTIKNHFRTDNSSYHVISYDTISGQPELKHTAQGYSNDSAWARGQAWGLYGYTLMYRFTKNPIYLEQAKKIADYIVNHPNLPEDKIPYWDYNAPDIPNALRDASAGAITCSALLELSAYTRRQRELYCGS